MTSSEQFEAENAVLIVKTVFALANTMNYKNLKPSTRANLLSLIKDLHSRYEFLLSSRPGVEDFVIGLLSMAQFEKTPTCLGILFPLFTQVTKVWALELEVKRLGDDLFKSFYRYFPVDVSRSFVQEPSVPTLQDLSRYLEDCITSHSMYADFAFEDLLGNLDTVQTVENKVGRSSARHPTHR